MQTSVLHIIVILFINNDICFDKKNLFTKTLDLTQNFSMRNICCPVKHIQGINTFTKIII